MTQLEFPYDQQATKENVYLRVYPATASVEFNSEALCFAVKTRPSRNYVEGDYYLYVEPVGSVVHHWMLTSKQLYPRELNQLTLTLSSYLRSEDNLEGVTLDEFSDTQSAIRWLNIMANEHGFGCAASHRGDEITLDGKTVTVIHYVSVTIEDFQAANKCVKWHTCRMVKV